jgi:hypothetical protein
MLDRDIVFGGPVRTSGRRGMLNSALRAAAPDPAERTGHANLASTEGEALYLPKSLDLVDFDLSDQRRLAQLSKSGRDGFRRALLTQRRGEYVRRDERRATRATALGMLLVHQRRTVLSSKAHAAGAPAVMRPPRREQTLRPGSSAPALPLATELWHSALMAAEVGYNPADLGLANGALRFEILDPQLAGNDRAHYQRPVVEARVQRYLRLKGDELEQRIGLLGCRDDSSLWVLDGQHHTEAAIRRGIALMGYWIFDSGGWEDERRVFEAFQEWKRGMGITPDETGTG